MSIGMNQLLWYYADMEKKRCDSQSNPANGTQNVGNTSQNVGSTDPDACVVWRRFAK